MSVLNGVFEALLTKVEPQPVVLPAIPFTTVIRAEPVTYAAKWPAAALIVDVTGDVKNAEHKIRRAVAGTGVNVRNGTVSRGDSGAARQDFYIHGPMEFSPHRMPPDMAAALRNLFRAGVVDMNSFYDMHPEFLPYVQHERYDPDFALAVG